MKHVRALIVLLSLFFTVAVHAYELATHGRLTYNAYLQSVLAKDGTLLKDLGLETQYPLTDEPFGTAYYDFTDSEVSTRYADPFASSSGRMPNEIKPLSLPGWFLRGAIREDDAYGEDNPQDDSFNPQLRRPLHHFYDPIYDRPLTVTGIGLIDSDIHTAPAWAHGTTNSDAFTPFPTPESARRNHFTVYDAREAMYRALTGKTKNDTDAGPDNQPATKQDRDKYWATLFRALGDIVHLIQDMGQPQHTRNDQHAGKFPEFLTGHASVYEKYIDCRVKGGPVEEVSRHQDYYIYNCDPLTYVDYPVPVSRKYSDYFSTRDGQGQGLADYSNRGFFTFGTNLGSNDYPSPPNDRNQYEAVPVLGLAYVNPLAKVNFLIREVVDNRTGARDPALLTTESSFDFFIGTNRSYSLNKYNYDDMAALLLPRAVAYSTGMINYFFRGRIEAEDAHYTDTGIELKVKNAIDPDTAPTEWQNEKLYAKTSSGAFGKLRIAYEYKDENDVIHYGVSDSVDMKTDTVNGDDDVAPGKVSRETYSFSLSLPSGVVRNLKYRLVFRGRLGNEDDAVVVGAFKPVSGFLVTPNNPPADGIPGARMIYKTAAGWKLAPDEGLVAGNTDWKGWYEGNPLRATKVLSWMGPTSRYFGVPARGGGITSDPDDQAQEDPFAPEIYHNGEIFSVAPKPVLGSALVKDANNKVWIVAICRDGYADVIYRRPYKKSTSAALYNPDTAKDGWQEIGRSVPGPGDREPGTPWFFNGNGTAAQTMRKWVDPGDQESRVQLKRLIANIDVNAPSASVSPKTGDPAGFSSSSNCSLDYDSDGAGSGTIASSGGGSYVIAVDYDNMAEVLAIVNEGSSGNTTTTVTVTKDEDGDVTSTNANTVITNNQSASLSFSGGTPLTILASHVLNNGGVTTDSGYKHAEITYYLDLRKKLYVYYEYESTQAEERIDETTAAGSSYFAERMYVSPENPQNLFSNQHSNSYTKQVYQPAGVFSCAPSYPTFTRYEPNFGWVDNLDIGGGGWAVDVTGNVLVSQKFYSDVGYEIHDAFNYLKDGDINAVLGISGGAPAYYPVGVLY